MKHSMNEDMKKILIGVIASGVIAPVVSVITVFIVNKIQEKMKR